MYWAVGWRLKRLKKTTAREHSGITAVSQECFAHHGHCVGDVLSGNMLRRDCCLRFAADRDPSFRLRLFLIVGGGLCLSLNRPLQKLRPLMVDQKILESRVRKKKYTIKMASLLELSVIWVTDLPTSCCCCCCRFFLRMSFRSIFWSTVSGRKFWKESIDLSTKKQKTKARGRFYF